MKNNQEIFDNINYIKKFFKQMNRSFEDAKTCRKCNESCGDIFYNSYEKVYKLVDDVENSVQKLIAEIEKMESLENVVAPINTPQNFVLQSTEDIEDIEDVEDVEDIKIQELEKLKVEENTVNTVNTKQVGNNDLLNQRKNNGYKSNKQKTFI